MALFFLTYELRDERNYQKLYKELDKYQAVRILESTWCFKKSNTTTKTFATTSRTISIKTMALSSPRLMGGLHQEPMALRKTCKSELGDKIRGTAYLIRPPNSCPPKNSGACSAEIRAFQQNDPCKMKDMNLADTTLDSRHAWRPTKTRAPGGGALVKGRGRKPPRRTWGWGEAAPGRRGERFRRDPQCSSSRDSASTLPRNPCYFTGSMRVKRRVMVGLAIGVWISPKRNPDLKSPDRKIFGRTQAGARRTRAPTETSLCSRFSYPRSRW